MDAVVKISPKGQVTIPKRFRNLLKTDVVRFRLVGDKIVIEPVEDLGGVFRNYAKKGLSYEEERGEAWQKVADEYRDLS